MSLRNVIRFTPKNRRDPLLYLSGQRTAASEVIDLATNGLDASVVGGVLEAREALFRRRGQVFPGRGGASITVPSSSTLTSKIGHTHGMLLRHDGIGESNTGRVLSFALPAGTVREEISHVDATTIRYTRMFADGPADWDATKPGDGRLFHYMISHDGSADSLPVAHINGRPQTYAVSTARSAGVVNDATGILQYGNRVALDRTDQSFMTDMRFWGSVLSSDNKRLEYLQYGTLAKKLAEKTSYTVVSASSGPSVGPWQVVSGTWNWTSGQKLVCNADGVVVAPSAQAYGGWYFKLTKGGAASSSWQFIASRRAAIDDANQDGYAITIDSDNKLLLQRIASGAALTLFSTAAGYIAADTEYEVFIARAYDGLFNVWVRGGAYSAWAQAGNATNTTNKTSNFWSNTLDADDKSTEEWFYPLGDTLDPRDEIPGLED